MRGAGVEGGTEGLGPGEAPVAAAAEDEDEDEAGTWTGPGVPDVEKQEARSTGASRSRRSAAL